MPNEHDLHLAKALKRDALTWASRAAELDNAIISLRLPYTYQISNATETEKTLGGIAAERLEVLRDEFMENAVQGWLNAKKMAGGDNRTENVAPQPATPVETVRTEGA